MDPAVGGWVSENWEYIAAGALVVMADGTTKPISQVQVGERVLAHDPTTGHTRTIHNLATNSLHNYHLATTTGQAILVHNNQDPITGENGACESLRDIAEEIRTSERPGPAVNQRILAVREGSNGTLHVG